MLQRSCRKSARSPTTPHRSRSEQEVESDVEEREKPAKVRIGGRARGLKHGWLTITSRPICKLAGSSG